MSLNFEKSRFRTFMFWLGSYTFISAVLFFYGKLPILPIAMSGLITLAITLFRIKKNRPADK